MLIVFEAPDKVGKTTLSKKFCEMLNTEIAAGTVPTSCCLSRKTEGFTSYPGLTGEFGKIPVNLGPFVWTKEPSFTSEEADRLNTFSGAEHQYKRELLFYESRLNHQEFLEQHNIVCDRYTWSGMVYAKVFSPDCYETYRRLYKSKRHFIQPDLYIYVNAGIDTCLKRDPSLNMDTMLELWKAYETVYDDVEEIGIPIITINNEPRSEDKEESIKLVLDELMQKFKDHLKLVAGK